MPNLNRTHGKLLEQINDLIREIDAANFNLQTCDTQTAQFIMAIGDARDYLLRALGIGREIRRGNE